MYSIKVLALSFFYKIIYSHNGKLVTINQLTYHDPRDQLHPKNVVSSLGGDHNTTSFDEIIPKFISTLSCWVHTTDHLQKSPNLVCLLFSCCPPAMDQWAQICNPLLNPPHMHHPCLHQACYINIHTIHSVKCLYCSLLLRSRIPQLRLPSLYLTLPSGFQYGIYIHLPLHFLRIPKFHFNNHMLSTHWIFFTRMCQC
jgi:hypothetical protein